MKYCQSRSLKTLKFYNFTKKYAFYKILPLVIKSYLFIQKKLSLFIKKKVNALIESKQIMGGIYTPAPLTQFILLNLLLVP